MEHTRETMKIPSIHCCKDQQSGRSKFLSTGEKDKTAETYLKSDLWNYQHNFSKLQ